MSFAKPNEALGKLTSKIDPLQKYRDKSRAFAVLAPSPIPGAVSPRDKPKSAFDTLIGHNGD